MIFSHLKMIIKIGGQGTRIATSGAIEGNQGIKGEVVGGIAYTYGQSHPEEGW